jgi:hypothetical protein
LCQWAAEERGVAVRLGAAALRALGAARSDCLTAWVPARSAVRVSEVSVRWSDLLQKAFTDFLAMAFWIYILLFN